MLCRPRGQIAQPFMKYSNKRAQGASHGLAKSICKHNQGSLFPPCFISLSFLGGFFFFSFLFMYLFFCSRVLIFMKSQGDKQEHVTLILGFASPGRKSGLRERKLGSGGGVEASPESGVFGQGQKHVGDQHEASHLEEETRVQPQRPKPGSRKSSQHLEWISGDTGGPRWHAALPLYFSSQIEKQNRHQGYIYITVFKLHFLLPSALHDKFQVFSNKKKSEAVEGRAGRAYVCA